MRPARGSTKPSSSIMKAFFMRERSLGMSEKGLADLYRLMEIATRENGMTTSRTAKASTKEEIRVENIQECGSKVC